MTIISASLFKALKEAGVSEALAEKASMEVEESTRLVLEQDNKIDRLSSKIDNLAVLIKIVVGLNITIIGGVVVALLMR